LVPLKKKKKKNLKNFKLKKGKGKQYKAGVVALTYNVSTQKAEAGRS
jgi:hypothetical protein